MRRARYAFETGRKYFAWAVAVKTMDLPGQGETICIVKVTLATPYVIGEPEGAVLRPSQRMEAVVWLLPDDKDREADRDFLHKAGIIRIDGQFDLPNQRSVHLACKFGERKGLGGFQPLEEYEIIPEGTYRVEQVVVPTRHASGLSFLNEGWITWKGEKFRLSKIEARVLRELDDNYPGHATFAQLREAVPQWRRSKDPTRTIEVTISKIRKKLPKGIRISGKEDVRISEKQDDQGWNLIVDEC